MFWPVVNFAVGTLVLILGFKPEWFSKGLRKELLRNPQYATVLKWCGVIVVGVSLLDLLGAF